MASLSIASLASFFSGEQKSISRGENHFKSGHVESFTYIQGILRVQIHASMKDKTYIVTIYLDHNNDIKSTECECPRGSFKCSHAAALFIYGIQNLSRTDVECSWKKKKTPNVAPKSAVEMFPPTKENYIAVSRMPSDEDRCYLYSQLCEYGKFTGLWWIMSPEPPPTKPLPVPTIDEFIFCEEFLTLQGQENQLAFLQDKASITDSLIKEIAFLTKGQTDNPIWHEARKGRLTASNFGCVLQAKRVTPYLVKRLLGEYDLSRVKAVQWGTQNEMEAINMFKSHTGLPVEETGVWLEKSGVLGASPDGLVGQRHVLEVKCPYTARNLTIEEAVKQKSFCLKKCEDGSYALKEDHIYWHQVKWANVPHPKTFLLFCSLDNPRISCYYHQER